VICPFCNGTMESGKTEIRSKVRNIENGDSRDRYHKEIHRKFHCNNCGAKIEHRERPEPYLEVVDTYNEVDRICRLIKAKLRRLHPDHSILHMNEGVANTPIMRQYYLPANQCRKEEERDYETQIEKAMYETLKNDWDMISTIIAHVFIDYMVNGGMRMKKRKFNGKLSTAAIQRLNSRGIDFNWRIIKKPNHENK